MRLRALLLMASWAFPATVVGYGLPAGDSNVVKVVERDSPISRISSFFSPPKTSTQSSQKGSQTTLGAPESVSSKSSQSKTSSAGKTTATPSTTSQDSTTSDPPTTSSESSSTPTTSSSSSSSSSTPPTTIIITSTSTSAPATSAPALTSALPASTTSAVPKPSGSSNTGIKVAIGIVGALAGLALVLLCIFWIRRSRRNRAKAQRAAVLEENNFQRGVGYDDLKDSNSSLNDGPVYHDERDPAIRRARQGPDAIPMTSPGSWNSSGPTVASHRPNSFEAIGSPEQLSRNGTPGMPLAPPAAALTPPPGAQQYVAYRPFASQYQPPSGAAAVAGLGGAAAAGAVSRKPLPVTPVGGQPEVAELESPVSPQQSNPSPGGGGQHNFSQGPSRGGLQVRNT